MTIMLYQRGTYNNSQNVGESYKKSLKLRTKITKENVSEAKSIRFNLLL